MKTLVCSICSNLIVVAGVCVVHSTDAHSIEGLAAPAAGPPGVLMARDSRGGPPRPAIPDFMSPPPPGVILKQGRYPRAPLDNLERYEAAMASVPRPPATRLVQVAQDVDTAAGLIDPDEFAEKLKKHTPAITGFEFLFTKPRAYVESWAQVISQIEKKDGHVEVTVRSFPTVIDTCIKLAGGYVEEVFRVGDDGELYLIQSTPPAEGAGYSN